MDQIEQMQLSRQKHQPVIEAYVNEVLLPVLTPAGAKVSIEPAAAGSKSHVYYLEGVGFDPLVLRGEPNRIDLKRRIRGHQILLQRGFDAPAIVHQDLATTIRNKYGFYFIAETRIRGCYFNAAEDTALAGARLGEFLARMHQITSWGHGWPGEFRWPGSIIAAVKLRTQAREMLAVYRRRYGRSVDDIVRWLKEQPLRAWFSKPRLTTGGFIYSNVMMEGDKVVIIDLARVRYANVARDLAQIRLSLIGDDPKARAAFFESYRRSASPTLLAELDTTQRLSEVLFLIRSAVKEKNSRYQREREQKILSYCEIDTTGELGSSD
jgi:aminoglycoside phosphotransferase (APT) family kinase protein